MVWVFLTLDIIIFLIVFLSAIYLIIFSVYSMRKRADHYSEAKTNHSIAVLFPSYGENNGIDTSVATFLNQKYPKELYEVVVIADHMNQDTMQLLKSMPVTVIEADFENSTKAKALNLAMDHLKGSKHEIVVILDADNTTDDTFLYHINKSYDNGMKAIQAHRQAKNRDTNTAVLDALSEEINNSIFRKGHVNLGFSSALIGSGMAFDYHWFEENIKKVSTAGEDKEIEALLLSQEMYIEYLEYVHVYDEKTKQGNAFYNQRRRWLAAQFDVLRQSISTLPKAFANGNYDYCDKLLQWMLLPRVILIGIAAIFAVAMLFINWIHAIKWWLVLLVLLFAMSFATPDYLIDNKFRKAIKSIPLLGIMMVANMFRLRGVNKKFIHTNHSAK